MNCQFSRLPTDKNSILVTRISIVPTAKIFINLTRVTVVTNHILLVKIVTRSRKRQLRSRTKKSLLTKISRKKRPKVKVSIENLIVVKRKVLMLSENEKSRNRIRKALKRQVTNLKMIIRITNMTITIRKRMIKQN